MSRAGYAPCGEEEKGYLMQRMTKQRQAVFAELSRVNDFRSAQQIFEDIQSQGQRVGLATVYRNLQSLADEGTVDVLRSAEGESLFRYCKSSEHHHHLVCRICGAAAEIAQHEIESWVGEVAAAHGYTDVSHSMELFGLCSKCTRSAE